MWHDFSPNNPLRSPRWRHNRIRLIVEGTLRYNRRRDDAWIKRGWRFYTALYEAQHPLQLAALSERYPALYWAHSINENPSEAYDLLRCELEARLLAAQDYDAIASRVGCSSDVVRAYHELYYQVRPKLTNRSYILHRAIGPAVQRQLSADNFDALWKLYGYFGGPHVVDAVVDKFTCASRCLRPDDVPAFIEDAVLGNIRRNAMIVTHTMLINGQTQGRILNAWMKLREIEAIAETGSSATASLLSNLDACFKMTPFCVAGDDAQAAGNIDAVKQYDDMSAELRCDEQMRLAAGEPLRHRQVMEQMDYAKIEATVAS